MKNYYKVALVGAVVLAFAGRYAYKELLKPAQPVEQKYVGRDVEPFETMQPRPVTLEKFNQIETGMTYEQVEKIMGTPGERDSESEEAGTYSVTYVWKNPGQLDGSMHAYFENGQLKDKGQYMLK